MYEIHQEFNEAGPVGEPVIVTDQEAPPEAPPQDFAVTARVSTAPEVPAGPVRKRISREDADYLRTAYAEKESLLAQIELLKKTAQAHHMGVSRLLVALAGDDGQWTIGEDKEGFYLAR